MKNKIDNLLLAILWVLCVTLGTSFWFNINFGFNIFSAKHWQYLSQMQAAQTPVHTAFYISFIMALILLLGGLYILIVPRLRQISILFHKQKAKPVTTAMSPTPSSQAQKKFGQIRPQRPNNLSAITAANKHVAMTPPQPTIPQTPERNWPEIADAFTAAGYVVKNVKNIGKVRPVILGLGTDDSLWVATGGISVSDMDALIKKMHNVFESVLSGTPIDIHGIVVSPTGFVDEDIPVKAFDNIDMFADFIAKHPNPPLTEENRPNFEAFSEFIDAIIQYMGIL